jgi:hypothetical protein
MEVARDTHSFAVPPCVRNASRFRGTKMPDTSCARGERCLRTDGGMPDDCSAERPIAPLGNRWVNSAWSPVILFWSSSAENRRGNRYRFDDRSANLVTSPAPRAQRMKSERRFPPPWSIEDNGACFIVRDHGGQKLALRSSKSSKAVADTKRKRD